MANHVDDVFFSKLIAEVQKKPLLWNRYNENHYNRYLTESGWEEVAIAMDRPKVLLRAKWRNIKDQFKRELKKVSNIDGEEVYAGKWRFFNKASFLKETFMEYDSSQNGQKNANKLIQFNHSRIANLIMPNPEAENDRYDYFITFKEEPDGFDEETAVEETVDINSDVSDTCPSTLQDKNAEFEEKKDNAVAGQPNSELNEDVHFAMSLVPFLRKLDPLKKLLVRNDIQSLLYKALSDNNK